MFGAAGRHVFGVQATAGIGAGPRSMRVMASSLRRAGHRVRDWGLGHNSGDAKQLRMRLVPTVEDSKKTYGEPVVLVGWSLGGYLAREYAREHPDHVRKVITLGSPVIGGPRYTATAKWYRSQGHDLDAMEQAVADARAAAEAPAAPAPASAPPAPTSRNWTSSPPPSALTACANCAPGTPPRPTSAMKP